MPGNDIHFGVDKWGEELKIYWVMYQNRHGFKLPSMVLTAREMQTETENFFLQSNNLLPPVFEPVLMSLKEYQALTDFSKYKTKKTKK